MKKGSVDSVREEVKEVIDTELENIQRFTMELARGMVSLY